MERSVFLFIYTKWHDSPFILGERNCVVHFHSHCEGVCCLALAGLAGDALGSVKDESNASVNGLVTRFNVDSQAEVEVEHQRSTILAESVC